jgi:hypothetical protein
LLQRAVENPEVAAALPRTGKSLKDWNAQTPPGPASYAALVEDLGHLADSSDAGALARRLCGGGRPFPEFAGRWRPAWMPPPFLCPLLSFLLLVHLGMIRSRVRIYKLKLSVFDSIPYGFYLN